jgi:hypothetical protein
LLLYNSFSFQFQPILCIWIQTITMSSTVFLYMQLASQTKENEKKNKETNSMVCKIMAYKRKIMQILCMQCNILKSRGMKKRSK